MKALPLVFFGAVTVTAAVSLLAAEPAAPQAAPAAQAAAVSQPAAPGMKLETPADRFSYSVGMKVAGDIRKQGFDVKADIVARGLTDGLTGAAPLISEEEMGESLSHMREVVTAHWEALVAGAAEAQKLGKAFLAENAKKPGVVTLPDGLQYRILKPGTGASPRLSNEVTVNYSGKLIDGTEFDSSYQRGQAAHFLVRGVIPGWQEALRLMKKGAKWELFVPSELAYAERGMGPTIGPNQVLIFTVELVDVQER